MTNILGFNIDDATLSEMICCGPKVQKPHNAWNKDGISDLFVNLSILATPNTLDDHALVLNELHPRIPVFVINHTEPFIA